MFDEIVMNFVCEGGCGLNVIVFFKFDVYVMLMLLLLWVELVGVVNMFKFDGDEIFGDNIDGVGLMCDIIYNIGNLFEGECVLLLGVGGVVCGVLLLLLEYKFVCVFIVNCMVDCVNKLVECFEVLVKLYEVEFVGGGYDEFVVDDVFDVIINVMVSSL